MSVTAGKGLVPQKEKFGKEIAGKSCRNYLVVRKNEFAYNKSYSDGYPVGSVKRLDKYDQGALSSLYICFSLMS